MPTLLTHKRKPYENPAMMRELSDRMLSKIDRARFDEVRALFPDRADGPSGVTKYLDLGLWIEANVKRAMSIGLHLCSGLRVLDIGTGCGYFPFVARELGHEVIALDCADRSRLFRLVTATLGVEVHDYEVRPFVDLPPVGTFDLITSYMVTFNGHRSPQVWSSGEWCYFLDACHAALRPGGAIVLELNREPPPQDSCYTPELERFFLGRGAEITGHWPHHPTKGGHRLIFRR